MPNDGTGPARGHRRRTAAHPRQAERPWYTPAVLDRWVTGVLLLILTLVSGSVVGGAYRCSMEGRRHSARCCEAPEASPDPTHAHVERAPCCVREHDAAPEAGAWLQAPPPADEGALAEPLPPWTLRLPMAWTFAGSRAWARGPPTPLARPLRTLHCVYLL